MHFGTEQIIIILLAMLIMILGTDKVFDHSGKAMQSETGIKQHVDSGTNSTHFTTHILKLNR